MSHLCLPLGPKLTNLSLRLRDSEQQTSNKIVLFDDFNNARSIKIDVIHQKHTIITLNPTKSAISSKDRMLTRSTSKEKRKSKEIKNLRNFRVRTHNKKIEEQWKRVKKELSNPYPLFIHNKRKLTIKGLFKAFVPHSTMCLMMSGTSYQCNAW